MMQHWSTDFNLRPISKWQKLFEKVLHYSDSYYPRKLENFRRKDIDLFVKNTKIAINHQYKEEMCVKSIIKYKGFLNIIPSHVDYEIYLPYPWLFSGTQQATNYYYVLFHELIHWTGSKNNMARQRVGQKMGEFSYAREEIIATLGGIMLLEKFGLYTNEINDKCISYITTYLPCIINGLSNQNLMRTVSGWIVADYLAKEPILLDHIALLKTEASNAVKFLEKFQ